MSRARRVFADTLRLGISQTMVLGLTALQTLIAARVLGPHGFGVYALVTVLLSMAALGTPGFLGAASREIPHLRSLGDQDGERRVFLHTVWGEIGFAVFWAIVIALFAISRNDTSSRLLLLLAAATIIPAKLYMIYQLRGYVEKDFGLQAKIDAIRAFISVSVISAFVWTHGVYAVLCAPLVANLLGAFIYSRKYALGPAGRELLDTGEFKRLGRIGLPITGLNIVAGTTGLQNWGERLIIGGLLGSAAVGVYAFFVWIVLTMLALFGSLLQVLKPHIYELMSQEMDIDQRRRYFVLPTWAVSVSSMVLLGGAAVLLPEVIRAFLHQYAEGTAVMYILLGATVISCVFWIPVIVINSARVNGQFYHFISWCIAVLSSLALDYLLVWSGMGMEGVACGYLLAQVIILGTSMWRVHKEMFGSFNEMTHFIFMLFIPAANVGLAVLAVNWIGYMFDGNSTLRLLLIAALKGVIFIGLCLPTLFEVERRTKVLSGYIFPRLRRGFA